jgi:hypothetical protein
MPKLPKKIRIGREVGYWTEHIGKTSDGRQYIGMIGFAETHQRRLTAVLHLFGKAGEHLTTEAWESEPEANLQRAIQALPGAKGCDVTVQPFTCAPLDGVTFGLLARDDGAAYVYKPFDLAFFPPWDGTYST